MQSIDLNNPMNYSVPNGSVSQRGNLKKIKWFSNEYVNEEGRGGWSRS